GGPNGAPTLSNAPTQFQADTTRSYELGVKATMWDHRLSFDGSVYYIDWRDVQLSVTAPNTSVFVANGGGAKSQRLELSAQVTPLDGLTVAGWVAVNDAALTQDIPSDASGAYGKAGDRLPYSSRFSGSLSIQQRVVLGEKLSGHIRASGSYVGHRESEFAS